MLKEAVSRGVLGGGLDEQALGREGVVSHSRCGEGSLYLRLVPTLQVHALQNLRVQSGLGKQP